MPSKHKRDFTCYLPPDLFDSVDRLSVSLNLKRSAFIERALVFYLKHHHESS